MNILDAVDAASLRKDIPQFRAGDELKIHVRVIEGSKSRLQVFQGIVIRRQGDGVRETFTIRKVSYGVGVERTFPVHTPVIEKIELVKKGEVRRAKLYYLRDLRGKAAKIREKRDGVRETFTIRKVSYGVGVERTFPVHTPVIEKIELVKKGEVRRAKLYYLRDLRGKAAKIREKRDGVEGYGDGILSTPEPIAAVVAAAPVVEEVVEAPVVEAVVEAPVVEAVVEAPVAEEAVEETPKAE